MDSIGQSLSSGAIKLSTQEKQNITLRIVALRNQISTTKEASTQHVTIQQLGILNALISRIKQNTQWYVGIRWTLFPKSIYAHFKKQLGESHTLQHLMQKLQKMKKKSKNIN